MEGNTATLLAGQAQRHDGAVQPTVTLEPLLPDQAAVADNAHAGQSEVLFAKLHQLAQVVAPLVNERLSARKVYLLHTWEKGHRHVSL